MDYLLNKYIICSCNIAFEKRGWVSSGKLLSREGKELHIDMAAWLTSKL